MGVQGTGGGGVPIEKVREELARGANALSTALYSNEKTSAAVLKVVNEQDKIGTTAKAAVLAVTQTAEKAGIAPRVIPSLAALAVDEVISMASATGIEYSEDDSKKILMSAMEMTLSAYGVDEGKARQLAERASPEEKAQMENIYKQAETQNA
jgi:hypothetical protein